MSMLQSFDNKVQSEQFDNEENRNYSISSVAPVPRPRVVHIRANTSINAATDYIISMLIKGVRSMKIRAVGRTIPIALRTAAHVCRRLPPAYRAKYPNCIELPSVNVLVHTGTAPPKKKAQDNGSFCEIETFPLDNLEIVTKKSINTSTFGHEKSSDSGAAFTSYVILNLKIEVHTSTAFVVQKR